MRFEPPLQDPQLSKNETPCTGVLGQDRAKTSSTGDLWPITSSCDRSITSKTYPERQATDFLRQSVHALCQAVKQLLRVGPSRTSTHLSQTWLSVWRAVEQRRCSKTLSCASSSSRPGGTHSAGYSGTTGRCLSCQATLHIWSEERLEAGRSFVSPPLAVSGRLSTMGKQALGRHNTYGRSAKWKSN